MSRNINENKSTEKFIDIADWSESYVEFVTKNGLMKGYNENGKTIFKPKNNITREEMAVVICNIINYFKKN